MKKFYLFLVGSVAFLPMMAQTGRYVTTDETTNDVNTPLHLMKPDYGFYYGIPTSDAVKQDMDRVLAYLEHAMPVASDRGKLKQGAFRLTSYESGVLYAAVQNAWKNTGDQRYLKFAEDRLRLMADLAAEMRDSILANRCYDEQMRTMVLPGALDDSGAMCAAYCHLSISHPYKAFGAVIENYMNCIKNQYRVGKDRIFARIRPHYNTVWLDDMYMGIPALAWYGSLESDTASINEAVRQIRAFKSRMWIEEHQLFRHGWVEEMHPHPFFPWGRANGWAILTMCEVLDAMAQAVYTEGRDEILELLRKHIDGLCALQDKSGFWHQLLNDQTSYLETSATAIYTYCLAHAINEGWIDPLAYGAQTLLAWNAVSTQINEKGQVENTCVGSGMGFDRAFYCYRPVHPMAAHGYGPVIWAGGEIIRLLGSTYPKMNDSAVHFYPIRQMTNEPIFSEER